MASARRPIGLVLTAAAQLLWPARCAACAAYVAEGHAFCEACIISVLPLGRACRLCALPLDEGPCRACHHQRPPFVSMSGVFLYGGSIAEALLRLKHGRRREVARPLGMLLGPALGSLVDGGVDAIMPVPLHPRRLRARGFNQALELARAALSTLPPRCRRAIMLDALVRKADTPPLGRAPPAHRSAILSGAFAAQSRTVTGRRLLLVDDVLTSGATTRACSETLLEAGASEVHVLALARAV